MKNTTEIRPKLKQDSIFLPINDGILFRNGNNVFFLKGKSVYRWVSALVPHLTGEQTLEDLCAALEPDRRELVSRLVQTLLEKGILKNHLPEDSVKLPEVLRAQFQAQIQFIDHYADRPVQRFTTFRRSRLLVVGSGIPFRALATSLIRNGLEELFLAPTEGAHEDLHELEAELTDLRKNGIKASFSVVDSSGLNLFQRLGDFQMVVYCSDRGSLRDVYLMSSQCFQQGRAFLPGIVFGGLSLIGPLVKPGAPGCWLCGMFRFSSNMDERRRAALWKGLALETELLDEEMATFIPAARMLGNSMAFELFKALGGHLPPESEGSILIQDLETLECYRAPLLPYPLCPLCSNMDPQTARAQLDEIIQGQRDRDLTPEEQMKVWYQTIDSRFGIFKSFSDEESVQLPLRTTLLIAGAPVNPSAGDFRITAHHEESTIKARHRALLEGITQYTKALPDHRRTTFASFRELCARELNPVRAEEFSIWSGGPSFEETARIEWLPAYDLFAQRMCQVPAAAIYPHSSLNRVGVFDQTLAGSGIGITFNEALTEGVLSMLCYERLRETVQGRASVFSLDSEELGSLDGNLLYLLKSVQRLGGSLRILELMSESPLRVILAITNDDRVSLDRISRIGSGLSRCAAAKQALLNLVGTLQTQSSQNQEREAAESLFPEFALPIDRETADLDRRHYEESPATMSQIYSFLQKRGRRVLFVDTTTRDVRETNTFITGTVLLTKQRENN